MQPSRGTPNPKDPHTSLPPIRQLHPFLPPPGPPVQPGYPPPQEYPYYAHPPPHELPAGPPPTTAPHRDPDTYGTVDSEGDDYDHNGPPKKKRRRQALSCTECKRRKIKCDRSQPCAPCTRRGDQAKCQWHIVEPIEKYVTRAEYDDLKARFDHLQQLVHRLFTTPPGAPPPPGASGAPVYYPIDPAGDIAYPPAPGYTMPPPQYPPGEGGSRRASGAGVTSPHLSRRSPTHQASPQMPSQTQQKKSPLSLAAITSPFPPPPPAIGITTLTSTTAVGTTTGDQSKNYHAQTLMLGERLRPEMHKSLPLLPLIQVQEDPALVLFLLLQVFTAMIHLLQGVKRCMLTRPTAAVGGDIAIPRPVLVF